MKKFVAILLVLGVAGCAPPIDRSPYLNALVNQPETEVVRRLGVPARTYETAGHRFIAYQERQTSLYSSGPSFAFGGFGGGYGYGGGFGGLGYGFSNSQVVERICETTFEITDGRVTTWSLRGNGCT